MKLMMTLLLTLALFLALFAANIHEQNSLLADEVATLVEGRERLLREIAGNASREDALANEIEILNNALLLADEQIVGRDRQVQETGAVADPDIQDPQASIRKETEEQYMREQMETDSSIQNVSMVRELARISPDRLNTPVRVNALYGDYFNALSVSDERMEVLVNAFIEMTEMQNDALDEVRARNPRTKEEAEALMLPILDSSLVNEVISARLTNEELALFTEYQENHFIEGLPVRPEF